MSEMFCFQCQQTAHNEKCNGKACVCGKKSDTARQYVEQWLPIVAAAELEKDIRLEKDFLMKWIDVMEYE